MSAVAHLTHDEALLDKALLEYLDRRSCTPFPMISGQFELHLDTWLQAALGRLIDAGLASYDERRDGYCRRRP